MGAWGIKPFENDDTLDWLYQLEISSDLSILETTINTAENDYLEAPDGSNILGAAEIILALQGKLRPGLPETTEEWIAENRGYDTTHLNDKTIKAIEKVLSKDSELHDLWKETDEYDAWVKDVTQLKDLLAF